MDFKEVEKKWRGEWGKKPGLFKAYDSDEEYTKAKGRAPVGKKYVLVEFPYPSGTGLHIGHAFPYTATDVYARYMRMAGYNVLCPMGWDAFGLPTENYAIKTKRKPQEITVENTSYFRQQMDQLAIGFDWERELFSTDPQYYKWTQWIFIKLWEKGLAEKQKMPINWCPSCKIGLANEEVIDGKCERCGTPVEKREMEQWVVKITAYAERLIDGLKDTDFIDKVRSSQVNWIGKKWGTKIRFGEIEVFTTRPDTIYGVSAIVVSPEHDFIKASQNKQVLDYIESVKHKSDLERTDLNKDKSGMFTGLYVKHPITEKDIPVWVADYVLNSFGTGAIMLVPAHDQKDFEFAKKYKLEIIKVVEDKKTKGDECFEGDGVAVNSGMIDGQATEYAKKTIVKWLVDNKTGEEHINYHLRDWIFSRQHYWGEPMPMWTDSAGVLKSVPETELPVLLPEVEKYEPTDSGESPLANIESFVNYKDGKRDTDTMPNWAGSDWYFIGYLMKEVLHSSQIMNQVQDDGQEWNVFLKNADKLKYWLPVDVYIGGDEHNTLHMLYSRFIYQFLYDIGMVPTPEPYFRRVSHGVILAPDGRRMSKSKGNTVDPIPLCEEFGVDVIRTSMMFMGPFDATMPWNPNTVAGVKRFLERFEKYVETHCNTSLRNNTETGYIPSLHRVIKEISDDLLQCKFNTPVAKLMGLLNEVEKTSMSKSDIDKMVIMLAPYAPYLTEELWSKLGHTDSVHEQLFPVSDISLTYIDSVLVPVCINGKKRGEILVQVEDSKDDKKIEKLALQDEAILKWIEGKEVIKSVYIENKMLNLVVR